MAKAIVWTSTPLGRISPNTGFCNSDNREICDRTASCSQVHQEGTIWFEKPSDEALSRLSGKSVEKIVDERIDKLSRNAYKRCRKISVSFREVRDA